MAGAAAGGIGAIDRTAALWVASTLVIAIAAPNSQQIVDGPWSAALRLPDRTFAGEAMRWAHMGFCAAVCCLLTLITLAKAGVSEFLYFNF
jgi:hypothetical protein